MVTLPCLVIRKIRHQPSKLHQRLKGRPCINIAHNKVYRAVQYHVFSQIYHIIMLLKEGSVSGMIYMMLQRSSLARKETQAKTGLCEIEPSIEAKHQTLLALKKFPCQQTLNTLGIAKSTAQHIARCCANVYWLALWESI